MRPRHTAAENAGHPIHPSVPGNPASMRPRHTAAENVVEEVHPRPPRHASMRPRHTAAENPIRTSLGDIRQIVCECERCVQVYARLPNHGPVSPYHLKEPLSKQSVGVFRALSRYFAFLKRSLPHGGRCPYGLSFSAPVCQTITGSRATASKRLPRLSTRGDTLSAGPRSTIRT